MTLPDSQRSFRQQAEPRAAAVGVGVKQAKPLGSRDQRKIATRIAIASAAVTLAAERGPDEITVEEIAAAAGVSYRTFFNYFNSKEEAFLGPMIELSAPERLAARPPNEAPLKSLYAIMTGPDARCHALEWIRRAKLVSDYPSLYPRYMEFVGNLERKIAAVLAERAGASESDLHPQLLAVAAVGALRLTLERCADQRDTRVFAKELQAAFDALEAGFPGGRPPGVCASN